MAKINLDKYYTSKELAKHCIDVVNELGLEITETIEPSAGNGSFSLQIPNCIAYDLEPEHETIIQQDFLKLELSYKKGRMFIGNPPFGNSLNLAKQFYKKCVQSSDYIAFILPISQLNNNYELHDFDLIYSNDLGLQNYSERKIHCCFNVYKRNKNGLNTKPNYKFSDVFVTKYRRNRISTHERTKYINSNYDLRICGFGSAIGKEVEYEGQYNSEYIIVCSKYKNEIIELIRNTNWIKKYKMIATPNLTSWMIYETIKEQIPELK